MAEIWTNKIVSRRFSSSAKLHKRFMHACFVTCFRLLTSCHEWQVMEVVLVFDELHEVSKASLNPDSCPANLFLGQVKYGSGADPLQLQIGRLQMVHNLAHKTCETI